MTVAIPSTSEFNVMASINKYLTESINAFALPSWLTSVNIVYNMPDGGIQPPCISILAMGTNYPMNFQGGNLGDGNTGDLADGYIDVSAWVTRRTSNWAAQLATLRSIIASVGIMTRTIPIYNYATPTTPSLTSYKINVYSLREELTPDDPNPDIERARYVLRYGWVARSA